jgi:enoyl-CoA hydratase
MYETIIVEKIGKASVLRFNRPEIKNPLSVATLENLERIFDALNSETTIEKIIFTGSGDTFASGANLKEVAGLTLETAREFGLRGQNLMRKIYDAEKLTVAAIDGFCMGGALDLALSCKLRIASPRSIFAHPGASLGIITGWSGTQILPRLVGKKKAFEMFLTAKKVPASEALEIGLINQISETVVETALEIQTAETRR